MKTKMSALAVGLVAAVVLSACDAGPLSPRASQGDIALCVHVRSLSANDWLSLKSRGEGGLFDGATDGELIGLTATANHKPGGSERSAVVARCRGLGAIS